MVTLDTDIDFLEHQTWLNEDSALVYATSHLAYALSPSQGSLSARLSVTLPQNAVVSAFQLTITARRADQAVAAEIAQLRGEPGEGANTHQIIVDFGTVRTISAAVFNISAQIKQVDTWNGTEFPLYNYNSPFVATSDNPPNPGFARFRSDVRTERLRIIVTSTQTIGALLADLRLILPDTPKDLAITMDGGAPVWTLPGQAAKGTGTTPVTDAWNALNERRVDLTDALRRVTGDPLNPENRTFELVLTSQEAGLLQIQQHALIYQRIRRAQFGGADATSLSFEAEGVTEVTPTAPDTPAGAIAQSISLTAAGTFELDRRIPATGPDTTPVSVADNAPLIEVEVTSQRAMILRLDTVAGLPAFKGLRLPLKAGVEGAELRLLPWENAGPGRIQPLSALEDLTGEPVALDPGGAAPVWTSLMFGAPLEIDPDNLPWVALLVARGAISVGLSDTRGAAMRVGPPSGPWRQMPALFGTVPYSGLRFPYRAIGDAVATNHPAPLIIEVPGAPEATTSLDPTPGGNPLRLNALNTTTPKLRITHFGAGALDLRAVDIVYDI